jgi:hypothetical protein
MPVFLYFLLIVIGLVGLSFLVERTAVPQTIKSICWAIAVCAAALFLLYVGLIVLNRLGLT